MSGDSTFALIWAGEGAVRLGWEVGTRCDCYSDDTHQPRWGCDTCGGFGVVYADAVEVVGLYRSRSAWTSKRMSGEHILGEAELTTPARDIGQVRAWQPGWTDDRVRDRLTVLDAAGDVGPGTIFYPSTRAVPFLFFGVQEGWRVQLQAMDQTTRVKPQP